MSFSRRFGLALTVVLACGSAAGGQMVVDAGRGFTFDCPAGYHRIAATGEFLYAFATSDPAAGVPRAMVCIQALPGRLPAHVTADVPPGAPAGMTAALRQWNGTDVMVGSAQVWCRGVHMDGRVAQLPTPAAIQVVLLARPGGHVSIDDRMAVVLAHVKVIGNGTVNPSADPYSPSPGSFTGWRTPWFLLVGIGIGIRRLIRGKAVA